MKKYVYMAVWADEYELPVAVADTAKELAQLPCIFGIASNRFISATVAQQQRKTTKRYKTKIPYRFLRILIES
ncbi:MAG: hypothetical protein RR764_11495 [Oscillospiraceae bacterium]